MATTSSPSSSSSSSSNSDGDANSKLKTSNTTTTLVNPDSEEDIDAPQLGNKKKIPLAAMEWLLGKEELRTSRETN